MESHPWFDIRTTILLEREDGQPVTQEQVLAAMRAMEAAYQKYILNGSFLDDAEECDGIVVDSHSTVEVKTT